MRVAALLFASMLFPLLFAAAEEEAVLEQKEMEELSEKMRRILAAKAEYDRAAELELVGELEEMITEIERETGIDDLLAHVGLWNRIRMRAVDGSAPVFRKTGWGFQEEAFIDGTEAPPRKYVYFISLPDGYDLDAEERYPVILFLHPEITGRYRKLEREVSELLDDLFNDERLLEKAVVIAPVGPLEKRGRKEEAVDAGKDWEALEPGRKTSFIAVRLLMEQMVFDRRKLFVYGVGNAAMSAYRYATWYPGFFAGAVGRDAELGTAAWKNARGIPLLYLSSSDNDPQREKAALAWMEEHDEEDGMSITVVRDEGPLLEPSKDATTALMAWMDGIEKNTCPEEVYLRTNDLAVAGSNWVRITELNVGLDTMVADPDCPWVRGRVDRASNTVRLETNRVFGLMLFFNDALLDLDREVGVLVNRKPMFQGMITRDLETLLELLFYNTAGGTETYVNFIELGLEEQE
jgi:hypothetical protein